ncbi:fumarate hydratase C-terminal domain-containing protein [Stappia indica]|uniref:fumarate hydratase C-terminal domain-containing protein n=1 Tax=Stappia indica TaxID=538381 RepID=UPI001CD511BF|nr:fumarate hydratase C-terminal domain-containing protein [Stappia indica]MCA1298795.1 fumarate hydratase C-terminal domain-containing protein [Stappia indica]
MSSDRGEGGATAVQLPMTPDVARGLRLGQRVRLHGEMTVTVGWVTHQRMFAVARGDGVLPVPLNNSFLHMGTCCYEAGGRILPHYVNPTTSTRFDAYLPTLVRRFSLTAIGGKGGVGPDVVAALKDVGGVYFSMPGGAAPALTSGVVERVRTGWDDLIEQFRLSTFRVDGFGPLIVGVDAHGNSIYEQLAIRANERLPAILQELERRRQQS